MGNVRVCTAVATAATRALWLDSLAVARAAARSYDQGQTMPNPKLPSPRQLGVYLAAIALLMFADPRPVTFAIGCAIVALAWVLRIWAFGHLDKNLHMVTTGPYAHTRNPAYLGSFLALVGVALAAGNPETTRGRIVWGIALLLCVLFFAVYLPRKFAREYGRLRGIFGEELERHAAHVPDFLPRLTPWRSGDPRRFSWARVSGNHEWPWGLVLGLLLVAIWYVHAWSPLEPVLAGGR
jgi:protein-S-isoprenylcysteine O-methyltransferase Ste14